MRRIIINIDDAMEDWMALERVTQVVERGMLSPDGSQYCYSFADGSHVSCQKRPSGTLTFYVGGSDE